MDCDSQFGGRVSLQIGSMRVHPTEAAVKLKTSQVSVDGKANQDGTAAYTVTPQLVSAEFVFRKPPKGVKWTNLMLSCSVNGTVVEEDNGRTHLFTNSRIVGDPEYDVTTGEISGIMLKGGTYNEV
jgi:hypothetical protein